MVNALHRDGGIGNGVALQVTHEALDTTVNLQTYTHTHKEAELRLGSRKEGKNVCLGLDVSGMVLFGGGNEILDPLLDC